MKIAVSSTGPTLQFKTIKGIKQKVPGFSKAQAQTWFTHIKSPINFILEQAPVKSSFYLIIYAPFFMARFEEQLDAVLVDQWNEFARSGWKVTHPIQATCHDDEWFTKEFEKVNY